jgi:hypothetical protein
MKRLVQSIHYAILAISVLIIGGCGKEGIKDEINEADARQFISSYINTLKSGDIEAIKKYWSPTSLDRQGFEVMHIWVRGLIHISEWKRVLDSTGYMYEMEELTPADSYCIVDGQWKKPDADSHPENNRRMPFYLVRENNKLLLINPIDILTKNWNRFETDNIRFIYPPDIDISDHRYELELLDKDYQLMCKAMAFSPVEKIEYFKASSPEECGRLLTQPPSNGLAAVNYEDSIPWFQIAVSTAFYNPHEVMHIVALSSGIPYRNSLFSEGLAVAFGGTTFQTAEYAHIYSKNIMNRANYIPIRKLLTMNINDFLRSNYTTYQESGSFNRYLIETYGIDKIKNFVANLDIDGDLDAQSLKVFNNTLDGLEKQWHQFLDKIEPLEIEYTVPDDAHPVFGMTDPENDDNGDGDYKYPADDKYIRGCFDLKKFEVLKTGNRACFRIGMQKVIESVSIASDGSRFVPAVTIAINKGDKGKRQLFKHTNGVDLPDGYDIKITVGFGVNVSNNLGKIFVSTDDCYDKMVNPESNELTFSLPIDIVGEPDSDWLYFVGTGLTDEPSFNFYGLAPVFKNNPTLISGGNFDYYNPSFIDILLDKKADQSKILSDYDFDSHKYATVQMVPKND